MRIRIINPNTTASMTAVIDVAARKAANASTRIESVTSTSGPASIEGYYDGALALPGLLAEIEQAEIDGADATIIACFDDTGLDAARCLAGKPVIGIGEASFHLASLVAGRFSVVTTLSRSIPIIEENLRRYGLAGRCARVRASEVPVLSLEHAGAHTRQRIAEELSAAIEEDRAEAIVLGCAGMADLAQTLSRDHGLPVIEGVSAAVKLAEALAGLGLSTSKLGGWASPLPKGYKSPSCEASPIRAVGGTQPSR